MALSSLATIGTLISQISQDHMIQGLCDFRRMSCEDGKESLMVSHHPTKLGVRSNWGDGDTMFLVIEGQDSTCCRFITPLLFISRALGRKAHGMSYSMLDVFYIWCSKFDAGHKKTTQAIVKLFRQTQTQKNIAKFFHECKRKKSLPSAINLIF